MQISHIEVRRHPILQRELHGEAVGDHLVAGPNERLSSRGRAVLATAVGMIVLAVVLMRLG